MITEIPTEEIPLCKGLYSPSVFIPKPTRTHDAPQHIFLPRLPQIHWGTRTL